MPFLYKSSILPKIVKINRIHNTQLQECHFHPPSSTTILSSGSKSCFNPFSYFLIFLRMTFFFENTYRPNRPPYNIFFYAKVCRNVQTTLGINLRPSIVKAATFPQRLKQKMETSFFSPPLKKSILYQFFSYYQQGRHPANSCKKS